MDRQYPTGVGAAHDSDDADVDAAFAGLIGANFPGESTRRRRTERTPLAPRPVPTPDAEPMTVLDRMDLADALDDEGWEGPEPRPLPTWPFPVAAATLALALGLVVGLVGLFGVDIPSWLGTMAAIFAVGGLAVLLSYALRRRGGPRDGDGAVV